VSNFVKGANGHGLTQSNTYIRVSITMLSPQTKQPYISNVTHKGQVTIPVALRRLCNITPGQKVTFVHESSLSGIVVKPFYPIKSVKELDAFGMWKGRKEIHNSIDYVNKMRKKMWKVSDSKQ